MTLAAVCYMDEIAHPQFAAPIHLEVPGSRSVWFMPGLGVWVGAKGVMKAGMEVRLELTTVQVAARVCNLAHTLLLGTQDGAVRL